MNLKENFKELKTTAIGFLLFAPGLTILIHLYFNSGVIIWKDYVMPIGLLLCGMGLMAAPDRFIDFLFGWAKKKTGQ